MDGVADPAAPTRLATWRRFTDGPLLVLAVGSLPLLLLEIERSSLPPGDRRFLDVVNLVVLVAFAIDYVVEIAIAERRLAHARREWSSLVIALAQALALAPNLGSVGVLRVLRAGRAWRAVATVGRVIAIGGAASRQGRRILHRHAAGLALGVAGLTWISAAVAFTLAENVGEGHRVESFFDALWWASTTIATVGYGDIAPVTGVGRIVAVFTMVVGISTFAVVTAKVAEFLVRSDRADASDAAAVADLGDDPIGAADTGHRQRTVDAGAEASR
jgi:voltage-gated potassium channel